MPLNFPQPDLYRHVSYSGFQQALGQFRFPMSPIEAINKFIDIVLQVSRAHAMESAQRKSFEIGDN